MFIFLYFFFLFPKLDHLNWSIFKLTNFLFWLFRSELCSYNEIFLSFIVLLISRIFIWFLFIIYLVKHHSHIFLLFFKHNFFSLTIFKIANLKNLCCKSENLAFPRDSVYWLLHTSSSHPMYVWAIPTCLIACLLLLLKTEYFNWYMCQLWKSDSVSSPGFVSVIYFFKWLFWTNSVFSFVRSSVCMLGNNFNTPVRLLFYWPLFFACTEPRV